MNRKVGDLTSLYNLYKGHIVFSSMDFAGTSCQLRMPLCFRKQEVLSVDQVVSVNKMDNFHKGRF
jgi:hypothetical protein